MRLTVVLFAALTLGPLALAQEEDVEPPPAALAGDDALSVAEVASHLKSLDDLALPEAQTEEARSHYLEAQAELRRAAQLAEQRRTFVELRERAPDDLQRVQVELEAVAPGQVEEALPEVAEADTVDVAQQAANAATSELQEARAEVERLRTAVEFRGERRVDAPSRIAAARQESALTRERLLQLEGEAAEIHPVLHEARSMHAQAQLRRLETEVQTLEAEVSSYDARRDLLQARLDLAQRRLRRAQGAAEAWDTRLAELRQAAAERTEERASLLRQRALALSPSMAHLAASNLELAARRAGAEGTVARLESKQERLARRRSQLREVRDSFSLVFSQIQAAGLAKALGRLLHAELNRTLDAAALEGEAERWREETARVQYERIQLRQVRRELSDLDLRLEALLQSLPAANRSAVRPVARELLSTQRELVDDLLDDYALLGSCLAELARANDELAQATREYRGFLEERILWLRSSDGLSGFQVQDALDGLAFYREGGNWSLALERSLEQLRAGWWWGFLWVLGAAGIVVGFRASHAQLLRAEEVAWSDEDTPWLAPLCLGWVALRAAPIPWLVLGAAGFLFAPPRQLLVAKSVATGLMAVALVLFAGGVVFTLAAPHGIGSLFRWRAAPRQALRRHLVWFVPVLAVASFVVVSMERQTRTELADSLGLLAFAVEALATAAILGVTLRPGGPLLNSLRQRHPDGLLLRVRWGWYLAVVALPLVLLALALEGYAYSGIQLMHRLGLTAVLVTGALLVRAALQRWITLAKLRHARRVAEARAEQQERESQDAPAEDDEDDGEEREREPAEEVAEGDAKPEPADLEAYLPDAEVRQLIRWGLALTLLVGTYAIWSSSLPALRQLDRLQVYPAMRVLPPQQRTST
ncbi:MAG: hypothetical protein R3F62_10790 [Planctomycetota bacterium]